MLPRVIRTKVRAPHGNVASGVVLKTRGGQPIRLHFSLVSESDTWQWHPVALQSSSELDLRRGLFLSCCRFLLAKYEPTGLLAFVEHHRRRWRLTV